VAPIFQTARVNVQNSLKASGHAVTTSRSRMRDALVIAQIGLSVVLLIGGGLLARSFDRLVRQDLGFDATNVLTFRLSPVTQDPSLYARLLPRLAALPGIERVGLTSAPPFSSSNTSLDLTPVEPSRLAPAQAVQCDWRIVSGDYFEALRVPLSAGRTFTPADNPDAPGVIMINETLARTVWGNENPVGKRVRLGSGTSENTIIGVVADFHHRTPDLAPTPAFFFSAYRVIQPQMTVLLRAHIPSEQLLPSVRAIVHELDPALPLHGVQMLSELGRESVARQRLQTTLFATLSVVAAALSLVGLYSVIAFSVAQRTREIGIRMALGARRSQIVRLIGTEGARLGSFGLALGLLASLGAGRFLESMLFGVTATDPWIYGGVAFLLGVVALAASLLPARRAARVDPMIALRAE
jgi:predicted permease